MLKWTNVYLLGKKKNIASSAPNFIFIKLQESPAVESNTNINFCFAPNTFTCFFAAKCGFLLGADGGNNGHLPGAIAIISLLGAVPST